LVVQFIYNAIRTGSPFRTAYGNSAVSFVFGTETLDGFLGLWASPGKSIFLYNPPLIFALFGIPLIVRRCRLWATALAVTAIPWSWSMGSSCSGAGTGAGGRAICSFSCRCCCCRACSW